MAAANGHAHRIRKIYDVRDTCTPSIHCARSKIFRAIKAACCNVCVLHCASVQHTLPRTCSFRLRSLTFDSNRQKTFSSVERWIQTLHLLLYSREREIEPGEKLEQTEARLIKGWLQWLSSRERLDWREISVSYEREIEPGEVQKEFTAKKLESILLNDTRTQDAF